MRNAVGLGRALGPAAFLSLLLLGSCKQSCGEPPPPAEPPPTPPPSYGDIPQAEFNHLATELALPLFWREDDNKNGKVDPDELDITWGLGNDDRSFWLDAEGFTEAFANQYRAMVTYAAARKAPAAKQTRETKRLAALRRDMEQGHPSLMRTDLRGLNKDERDLVGHLMVAAAAIEGLYARQLGTLGLDANIPTEDHLSRAHFFLNHGPACTAPATRNDPNCFAFSRKVEPVSGLYPEALQRKANFCERLSGHENANALLDPFVVVKSDPKGNLEAVPYSEAFRRDMIAVATALEAAAALVDPGSEAAFKAYLLAAAKAFRTNSWYEADEAWAAMSASNSKWYLRIGPDEVYSNPCNRKAAFHMSFARIDEASLKWQEKLQPHTQAMEDLLAKLAGPPYKKRTVAFKMPDFINVMLNAGDSRNARGGTAGQSLPNFGPVANEGRGRTVVMANIYSNKEDAALKSSQLETVMCQEAMPQFAENVDAALYGIMLHEAAHNLGPSHAYAVKGKTDDDIFGGSLAGMLEELKSEIASHLLISMTEEAGIVEAPFAAAARAQDITWMLGHISRGYYTAEGAIRPYSHTAAIIAGTLWKNGILRWTADQKAVSGQDMGCIAVNLENYDKVITPLAERVLRIKARGDRKDALALQAEFVDGKDEWQTIAKQIRERWSRFPQPSYRYAILY